MLKISVQDGEDWVDRDAPATFARQVMSTGGERIVAGVPHAAVFRELTKALEGPFQVLYVLHTPRGEGEPGRYQSPKISAADLAAFLTRFETYLVSDARHDLWVRSASSGDVLVWDRHNTIYGYGSLDSLAGRLRSLSFDEAVQPDLGDHMHHYRAEFDADAAEVLEAFDWLHTPLRQEDEQLL